MTHNATLRWKDSVSNGSAVSDVAISQDTIFAGITRAGGPVAALSRDTGVTQWTFEHENIIRDLLYDDCLYLLHNGVTKVSDGGFEQTSVAVDDSLKYAAIDSGTVFTSSRFGNSIYAIDVANGTIKWT